MKVTGLHFLIHIALKNFHIFYDNILTHWGRVTHICVGKLSIIGSDNGLLPGRCQAIIWTNAGILLIGPLGTNLSEILIGIRIFWIKEMQLEMSFAKWCPFCLGLNKLIDILYVCNEVSILLLKVNTIHTTVACPILNKAWGSLIFSVFLSSGNNYSCVFEWEKTPAHYVVNLTEHISLSECAGVRWW